MRRRVLFLAMMAGMTGAIPVALGQGVPAAPEQPLPLPATDYVATARLAGDGQGTFRHRQGRLRVEFTVPGMPVSVTGFLDLGARRIVVMSPVPGTRSAMEFDLGEEPGFGTALGSGRRAGTARVAGEACDLWAIAVPRAEGPVTACITADGITLRTQATVRGKVETVLEVTELKRERQDPQAMQPPADVRVIRVPGGWRGLVPGAIPGLRP